MGATAAFNAQVRFTGAAVSFTAEATTSLGSSRWQITNTAKRIVDPSVAVTVKDTGVAVAANLWTFDYLFGIVTFVGYTPTGAVTVDGSYLPNTATPTECKAVEINAKADLTDVSVFEAGYHQKLITLLDLDGSLDRLVLPLDDLDGVTAGTQSIKSWQDAGTPKVLDVLFAPGQRFRAWVRFGAHKVMAKVDGVVETNISFTGSPQAAGAVFSWGA